jgi:hypothetical protein
MGQSNLAAGTRETSTNVRLPQICGVQTVFKFEKNAILLDVASYRLHLQGPKNQRAKNVSRK